MGSRGNLKLIAWRPSPWAGTIERLFDRERRSERARRVLDHDRSGAKLITSLRAASGTLNVERLRRLFGMTWEAPSSIAAILPAAD